MQLLDLPDELLSELLKVVDVRGKQEHLQRTCMRFRRLLQRPLAAGIWGSIGVRLRVQTLVGTPQLTALLQWIVSRQAGISEVRLVLDADVRLRREDDTQMVLHALAGALAQKQTPLRVMDWMVLDFEHIQPVTLNVLASTLQRLKITCRGFQLQHWEALCSLRSLQWAVLKLRHAAPPPVQQPPFAIQSMQLSSLQFLQFTDCDVDVQPLMAHASWLTSLATLYFVRCSLGALPAGVLNLPQLTKLGMLHCDLVQLPPLAPLAQLTDLHLSDNPALTDLRPVLRGMPGLRCLTLQGGMPLNEHLMEALRAAKPLAKLDISNRTWGATNSAVLGVLVQLMHAKGGVLVTGRTSSTTCAEIQ